MSTSPNSPSDNAPVPPVLVSFLAPGRGLGQTGTLANVAWILAGAGRQVLVVDWAGEPPYAGDYLRPFLADHRTLEDVLGPRLTEAHEAVSAQLGQAPEPVIRRYTSSAATGWIDVLCSTRGEPLFHRSDAAAAGELRRLLATTDYDYVLFDQPVDREARTAIVGALSDVAVVCFSARQGTIADAAQLGAQVRAASPAGVDVVPVATMFDERHMVRPERALGAIRAAFASLLAGQRTRVPPRGVVDIPYQPYDAFDPLLTVLIEEPTEEFGAITAYTTLTALVTMDEVTELTPLSPTAKARYRRACGLDPAEEPAEILLAYASRERPWADWVRSELAAAGAHIHALSDPTPWPAAGSAYIAVIEPDRPLSAGVADAVAGVEREILATGRPVEIVRLRTTGSDQSPPPPGHAVLAGTTEQQARVRLLGAFGLVDAGTRGAARFPATEPATVDLPPANQQFVGRDRELENLRDLLSPMDSSVTVDLVGPMGIGKSELALEYAHRFAFDYDLVWWLAAHERQSVLDGIKRLGDQIGTPMSPAGDTLDILGTGRAGRWLIVYDNVDDPATVESLLPTGRQGHVIITSVTDGSRPATIHLAEFRHDESTSLLAGSITTLSATDAQEVADRLHHQPLALNLAAAWLAETAGTRLVGNTTTTATAAETARTFIDKVNMESAAADVTSPRAIEMCVLAVTVSTLRASDLGRVVVLLAELCSFLAPQGVSITMLRAKAFWHRLIEAGDADTAPLAGDTSELDRMLWLGARFGLFQIDWRLFPVLRMHRAVQAALQETMGHERYAQRQRQVLAALAAYAPSDVDNDVSSGLRRYDELRKHVAHSGALESTDDAVRLWLVNQIRYTYLAGGPSRMRATLADTEYLAARWAAECGDTDSLLLRMLAQKANIHRELGDNQTALEIDTAVVAAQGDGGPQQPHLQTLITARGRGGDLRGMGMFAEALSEDKATWEGFRQVLGEDHPHTRIAANNLALSTFLSGDPQGALRWEQDNFARRRRLFGPEDLYTWFSQCSIGTYLRELGRYREAVDALRTARDHVQALGSEISLLWLRIQWNLAITDRLTGRPTMARDRNEVTVKSYRDRLTSGHPWTIACAISLAADHRAAGNPDVAVQLVTECVHHYRHDVGLDEHHPFLALCEVAIGRHLLAGGEVTKAADFGGTGRHRLRDRLGANHPWALAAEVNLAAILAAQGNLTEAVALVNEAYHRLRESVGVSHPYTRTAEENLHRDTADWGGIDIDIPQT
jgi:tetratricopeptide (TPR) repeat protein